MSGWQRDDSTREDGMYLQGYITAALKELEDVLGEAMMVERSADPTASKTTRSWWMAKCFSAPNTPREIHVVHIYDYKWQPRTGYNRQTWHVAASKDYYCEDFLGWLGRRLSPARDVVPRMWLPPPGISIYPPAT